MRAPQRSSYCSAGRPNEPRGAVAENRRTQSRRRRHRPTPRSPLQQWRPMQRSTTPPPVKQRCAPRPVQQSRSPGGARGSLPLPPPTKVDWTVAGAPGSVEHHCEARQRQRLQTQQRAKRLPQQQQPRQAPQQRRLMQPTTRQTRAKQRTRLALLVRRCSVKSVRAAPAPAQLGRCGVCGIHAPPPFPPRCARAKALPPMLGALQRYACGGSPRHGAYAGDGGERRGPRHAALRAQRVVQARLPLHSCLRAGAVRP